MTRKPFELIRGLALFLLLIVITIAAVRLKLLIPRSILIWLSQSPNPQQAVIAFGAFVSSCLLLFIRLGVEFPQAKPLVGSDKIRLYVAGLPLWFIITAIAVSAGGLLLVFPACQAPTSVVFSVEGQQQTLQPGDTFTATPNQTLIVTAQPSQSDAILSCAWQYSGEVFKSFGSNTGCQTNVELTNRPSVGFLTLKATQDFCNQSSIFSIQIQIGQTK